MKIGILHNKPIGYGGAEYIKDTIIQTLSNHQLELYIPSRHIKLPYIRRYFDINRFINTRRLDNNDLVIETSGSLIPIFYSFKPYIAYCNGLSNTKIHRIPHNVKIISNSRYTQSIIKNKLNIDTQIIYPPVDIQQFYNNNNNKHDVISITRLSKEKNIQLIHNITKDTNISHKLLHDIPHNTLHNYIQHAKVFLSTSIETFGISTIECIASGCIPIVPNNSAHIETIPFKELRYNTIQEATYKVILANNGDYNYLLPLLQKHIQQFDISIFKNKLLNIITNP